MQKLGVVLFGASVYENHRELNNPQFFNSIKEIKKAIVDPKINRNRETEVLDLYNKSLLPSDVAIAITKFIKKDYDDFIFYYCGHGDVGRREGDYRVFLRQSDRRLRHTTMLHIAGLIRDVQVTLEGKRVFFVIDACYSGSAISEMQSMDAGGAENVIDRNLLEAIEGANGMAVLAASGKLSLAYALEDDKLTLFTGAFVQSLRDGIANRSELSALSWLDMRDEIARITRLRLGHETPVPKLTNFSDSAVDITRVPFFNNQAYIPREPGGPRSPWDIDERTSEHLYWKNITDESPLGVLEDFQTRFPNGIFIHVARDLLKKRINNSSRADLDSFLRDYPKTTLREALQARLATLSSRDKIQTLNDPRDLEQFLESHSQGELGDLARARLAKLKAKANDDMPPRVAPASYLDAAFQGARKKPGRAIILGLSLFVVIAIAATFARSLFVAPVVELASDFSTAGNDPDKLRAFISRCAAIRCSFEEEARSRLHNSELAKEREMFQASYRDLNAAGADIGALRKFIEQCKATACPAEQDARSRLAQAETDSAEAKRIAAKAVADHQALEDVGSDIEKLQAFVQRCSAPSCVVAVEAQAKLAKAVSDDAEAKRIAARAAADRQAFADAGSDLVKLQAFVQRCSAPSCVVAVEAQAKLAKAVSDDAEAKRIAARAAADRQAFADAGSDLVKLQAFVQRCSAPSCVVAVEAQAKLAKAVSDDAEAKRIATRAAADRQAFADAGSDLVKLQAFVQRCSAPSCVVAVEAQAKLAKAVSDDAEAKRVAAKAAADRQALADAGNDLVKLQAFVQRCSASSCVVVAEAQAKLAKAVSDDAEAKRIAAKAVADRQALADAGSDFVKLQAFVQRCSAPSCVVAVEAQAKLAKAVFDDSESKRIAAKAVADRQALTDAGNDLVKLQAFVQRCSAPSCVVAVEAQAKLAKAVFDDSESKRIAAKAAADRQALADAGNDLGKLQAFVQQCMPPSCAVISEAREQLAKAQELAKTLSFDLYPNYDIDKNDLEDGILFNTSWRDCTAKCQSNNKCVAFVFDKWNSACYLKARVVPLTQAPRSNVFIRKDQPSPSGATSVVQTCPYYGSSMTGNITKSFSSPSLGGCRKDCEADQTCLAYMFRKAERLCSFFSNVSTRTRGDPTSDSGERTQNPC